MFLDMIFSLCNKLFTKYVSVYIYFKHKQRDGNIFTISLFLYIYSFFKDLNARPTASIVYSMSSSVWANVMNHASYFEGARLIP